MSTDGAAVMAVERNQLTITLGDAAMKEYREVARYLGIPVATLLRQVVEDYHRSMDFASMLRRARAAGVVDEEPQP